MKLTFVEAVSFERIRDDVFSGDLRFHKFQSELMENPRAGDLIPGSGGVRKVRWTDERRGKGRRSGIRVIYLYVEAQARILLIFAYDKNTPDITEQQKRAFRTIAAEFKAEQIGKDY
ncbi:MAG TPA: hypothetical protein VFA07_15955 [Chthonomonadaceae bacterium]|nr:hypothetical protein [Chthonomonadaceae bacterium]